MNKMMVALAQLNFRIGDFEGNSDKIINAINGARKAGANLVVFSELAVTGYYPHDLLERKEFIESAAIAINNIAAHCVGIAALVGGPAVNDDEKGKKLYNAAWFLNEGKVQDVFYKTLLPTYDVFDEYRHFEPNREFHLLHFNNSKIAVTICEDVWDELPLLNEFGMKNMYQTSPLEELAKLKPDFIVNLSASPFSYDQENRRKDVLAGKARQYGLPIIYVNQVGANAEMIFDGGSVMIGSDGEILHELQYFKEDFRVLNITKPENVGLQPKTESISKIHDALVMGIGDYFRKSGFSKATLGLSGGIDSAVVVCLAVKALGAANVRVLLMPSSFSSAHSVADAKQLAENLAVEYDIISIQNAVDVINTSLSPLFGALPNDVTEENIQARARGVFIMALSNKFGHIVLNTTNKSECAVGYGTLYGDMNGGLAVLGDLYKTDVYRLANFINRKEEVIPVNSIVKPPSAELKPGQKDTDSLPDYDLLDKLLFNYIELNKSPQELVDLGFEKKLADKIVRMVNLNEYKRFQAAPILRISSKAFGFGRRMPIVAKF